MDKSKLTMKHIFFYASTFRFHTYHDCAMFPEVSIVYNTGKSFKTTKSSES